MNISVAKADPRYMQNYGWPQGKILFHYISYTLPLVKKELRRWRREALNCADPALRTQAINSISSKDFHCYGGAVFAVANKKQEKNLIKLIVAYQTICDYLDNLCDRNDCLDGEAFRQLHLALQDALQADRQKNDYYKYYPSQNDGGYLEKLVDECRMCLVKLPAYHLVYDDLSCLAQWYIDLQVNKHIHLSQREPDLIRWANRHLSRYPGILWQEFSAASGSTLAVFALFALASQNNSREQDSQATVATYFPWICGLHILLDYFIDQEEDRQGGDLNFTFYYKDNEDMLERLKLYISQAHQQAGQLTDPTLAKTVIEGLLALYLSDAKVKSQGYQEMARELIQASGGSTRSTYRLCSVVRKFF